MPNLVSMKLNPLFRLHFAAGIAFVSLISIVRAAEPEWKDLPLVANGKVAPDWVHVGRGKFIVDNGALRTEPDPKGLGLLVYKKERLGNCQIRIVYKAKGETSNSGVYVRIADGILEQAKNPGAAFNRDAAGKPSDKSLEAVKASADQDAGAWYAVHHGYEVQIMDSADRMHRTGAIYSLASAESVEKPAGDWRTLTITLKGEQILVDLDGKRVTTFDPTSPNLPERKEWYEPKREPKRPEAGYIGLQTHDPGDILWFKEVSVRPLPTGAEK